MTKVMHAHRQLQRKTTRTVQNPMWKLQNPMWKLYRQASQMEDTLLQNRLWTGGEAEQAGVKPSNTDPSDCEAEQAVEPSIANKPDDVQATSKAQMSASKAVRRRAAQKARRRRGK